MRRAALAAKASRVAGVTEAEVKVHEAMARAVTAHAATARGIRSAPASVRRKPAKCGVNRQRK
jgi:hypothetical protein